MDCRGYLAKPTYVTRNQYSAREAVIRMKALPILLESNNDIAGRVQCCLHIDRGSIRSGTTILIVIRLWELILRTGEAHEACTGSWLEDTSTVE